MPTEMARDIQEKINQTPAQRKAELQLRRQSRMDVMTLEQKQILQQRIDRMEAVPVDDRVAFVQVSRLARLAHSIRLQAQAAGLKFSESLALLNPEETDAINWLTDTVIAQRSE